MAAGRIAERVLKIKVPVAETSAFQIGTSVRHVMRCERGADFYFAIRLHGYETPRGSTVAE